MRNSPGHWLCKMNNIDKTGPLTTANNVAAEAEAAEVVLQQLPRQLGTYLMSPESGPIDP